MASRPTKPKRSRPQRANRVTFRSPKCCTTAFCRILRIRRIVQSHASERQRRISLTWITPLAFAGRDLFRFGGTTRHPIWAVPSMIGSNPVVDPSAAILNVVPGCCALTFRELRDELGAKRVGPLITSVSARMTEAVTLRATKTIKKLFHRGLFVD